MKNQKLSFYHTPAVYRGKSYVTKESVIGRLSFFSKGQIDAESGATITILTSESESAFLAADGNAFSAVAVVFVGENPSDALCHATVKRELPLLILGKLPRIYDKRVALLDSRTATLYVDPDLDLLARYARQLRFSSEAEPLSPRLLPHYDLLPLSDRVPAMLQSACLLSYAENGPLSLAYGEERLFETLCALAEETVGIPWVLPVHVYATEQEINEDALRTRLRALLRAAVYGSFFLLFEGLCHAKDVKGAFALLDDVCRELKSEGREFCADIPCAISVESLLLLHELSVCPATAFICVDLDRLWASVLPPLGEWIPSDQTKESFLCFLSHYLQDAPTVILARTVHSPHMHSWKRSELVDNGIHALLIPSEYLSLWQEWNAPD